MKPILDFQVLNTYDPRILMLADSSVWEHIGDKPAIIEITLPGESEPITHYFQKNSVNNFNSINLLVNCGLPCGCEDLSHNNLPDGIYTITLKGSPDTFNVTKKYLRTNNTQLEIDKMFLSQSLSCSQINYKLKEKVSELNFLLLAAEANTRLDQMTEAYELLMKVQKEIKKCLNKNCY